MANTSVTYTASGAQTNYSVPFPFISRDHVKVFVNTIELLTPTWWTWVSDSQIAFRDPPAASSAIKIQRVTPGDARLVDFQNGAVLTEADLDLSANQNFYLAQEAYENYAALVNNEMIRVGTSLGVSDTDTDLIIAGLVEQMLADANAANLQARITDIDANAEAIIDLENGLQVQINTLAQGVAANVYVQATAPVPGVGGVPDPILEGSRWYDSDDNNAPYIYLSGVWTSIEDPRIGDAKAYIDILESSYGAGGAALVTELTTMSNATTNVASELALLGAQNGGATAFIIDSNTVKLDSDIGDTLAVRFSQITADHNDNQAQITAEQSARISGDSVIASDVALLGAKNGAATAFILDTSTVKIDSDVGDTFATRFTALSAADSSNSAAITTINTVTIPGINSDVTALEARQGVQLNVNDYVTGFVQNNDGKSGTFSILTDKFYVVDPANGGQNPTAVFAIESGTVRAQNMLLHQLALSSTGNIHAGKTSAASTTKGFWLGHDGASNYDFRIGDATQELRWDGSANELSITGRLTFKNANGSFVPTFTGFTSSPSTTIFYLDLGKFVMLWSTSGWGGTSNATTMTITNLPTALRPTGTVQTSCVLTDNSADEVAGASIYLGTITFKLHNGSHQLSNFGFTASGTKGAPGGWSLIYPKIGS